ARKEQEEGGDLEGGYDARLGGAAEGRDLRAGVARMLPPVVQRSGHGEARGRAAASGAAVLMRTRLARHEQPRCSGSREVRDARRTKSRRVVPRGL
ncbi:MAG: hypothetical protein AVDCRST_MAG80-2222, partial [uncultured Rubrobacteraceae bacterium]